MQNGSIRSFKKIRSAVYKTTRTLEMPSLNNIKSCLLLKEAAPAGTTVRKNSLLSLKESRPSMIGTTQAEWI